MNIHHLELFYYVCQHGGISQAVRNMPYGIQQPAVSGQILQLEDDLGKKLFNRRPFSLTPAGEQLYQFIAPFFQNLEPMADKLRDGSTPLIRIGASEVVFRDYLPAVVQEVKKQMPKIKLGMRSGYQMQIESWLQDNQVDLAILAWEGRAPAGLQGLPLLKLPLVMVVRKDCPYASAQELWAKDKIEEALISLPPSEPIPRNFQRGLARLGVDWFPSIEASSLDLITKYVSEGYGLGVTVAIPSITLPKNLRLLALDGFEPLELAVLWRGDPTPLIKSFTDAIKRLASSIG